MGGQLYIVLSQSSQFFTLTPNHIRTYSFNFLFPQTEYSNFKHSLNLDLGKDFLNTYVEFFFQDLELLDPVTSFTKCNLMFRCYVLSW